MKSMTISFPSAAAFMMIPSISSEVLGSRTSPPLRESTGARWLFSLEIKRFALVLGLKVEREEESENGAAEEMPKMAAMVISANVNLVMVNFSREMVVVKVAVCVTLSSGVIDCQIFIHMSISNLHTVLIPTNIIGRYTT